MLGARSVLAAAGRPGGIVVAGARRGSSPGSRAGAAGIGARPERARFAGEPLSHRRAVRARALGAAFAGRSGHRQAELNMLGRDLHGRSSCSSRGRSSGSSSATAPTAARASGAARRCTATRTSNSPGRWPRCDPGRDRLVRLLQAARDPGRARRRPIEVKVDELPLLELHYPNGVIAVDRLRARRPDDAARGVGARLRR